MSLPITIRLDLRATAKLVVFATNLGFIREFEFACPHYAKKAKKTESCDDAHDRHIAVFPRGPRCIRSSIVKAEPEPPRRQEFSRNWASRM
jgi:hypothetical protein